MEESTSLWVAMLDPELLFPVGVSVCFLVILLAWKPAR